MRSPYGKDVDSDIGLRDNPYSYYAMFIQKLIVLLIPKTIVNLCN